MIGYSNCIREISDELDNLHETSKLRFLVVAIVVGGTYRDVRCGIIKITDQLLRLFSISRGLQLSSI